jgi:hypothetical protein
MASASIQRTDLAGDINIDKSKMGKVKYMYNEINHTTTESKHTTSHIIITTKRYRVHL